MRKMWKRLLAVCCVAAMLMTLPGVYVLADELQDDVVIISIAEDPEVLPDDSDLPCEDANSFAEDIPEESIAEELVGIGNYGANLDTAYYHSPTNPFSWGQCTWYAYGRALEKTGVSLPYRGHAKTWISGAVSTPMANSIAVWTSGTYGHVAYVEAVDNNKLYISEANRGNALTYSEGIIRLSDGYYTPTYEGKTNAYTCGVPDGYIPLSNTPTVTFTPWSNDNYTYIRETDASIGMRIDVTGGTCTYTGMYLFDSGGTFLAEGYNESYTYPQVYFQINSEMGYTLRPGTTYKYAFYAIVNEQWFWSDEYSFTTPGNSAPSVTFIPWSNDTYTYIRETDASIGMEINVSGGTCTSEGMYLYDSNGSYLASASNPTHTLARVYFQVNTEMGYTLQPATLYKYKFYAEVNGQRYWSNEYSFKTIGNPAPTVTFTPWSNDNYTYIRETDASIGMEINVSGGTCTSEGMYLYDSSGSYLASASNPSHTLARVYFQVNAEMGYTLREGTTYKYKFYAVVNGQTYWSNEYSFTTTKSAVTNINNCTVTLATTSYIYNGSAWTPSVTVKNGSASLSSGTDYTVSFSNNVNAGTATATVTGKGNYTGTITKTFSIAKASPTLKFASSSLSKKTGDDAFTNTLTKTTDGAVTFKSSNTSVATVNSTSGKVTIKGAGTATITATAAEGTNYKSGSASYTLTVTASKTDISGCTVTLSATSYTYNGKARKPSVTVTNGSATLAADTDYTVSYSNNTNAGTATVTITGKGDYTGTASKTFTINKDAAKLTFANTTIAKTTKDAAFTNTLTKTTDGTVTFKSSNTGVATVNSASGLVTIKGAGTATITATASAGTNYKSGSASYSLTVTAPASAGFSDVQDPSHPYYKAIYWAADAGITKGYPDGTFGIDRSCTRSEAVMFLWRMAGKPTPVDALSSPFSDVPKSHAHYKAILWAAQKGITKGYSDGTFGINKTCTRGQIMTFIWRFKGQPAPKAVAKSPFSDVPKNHAYYKAILWGAQTGVTNGFSDGTFGINKNCTRGQIVTFLYRIK